MSSDYYDKEYFDGGKGYHTYSHDGNFAEHAEDLIRLYRPKSVLDVGCAKGFLVKEFRDRGIPAYGVDISEYAVRHAPKDIKEFLRVVDITKPVGDIGLPRVDLVVSSDTLEHVPEEHLDQVEQFLLASGDRYYIKVGTLDTPNWEHDSSHINMHYLAWWIRRFPYIDFEESR